MTTRAPLIALAALAALATLALPRVAEARGINHTDAPVSLKGGYTTLNTHVPKAVQAAELAAGKHSTYGHTTGTRESRHERFGANFGAPIVRVR
jgi:hypothetical protein